MGVKIFNCIHTLTSRNGSECALLTSIGTKLLNQIRAYLSLSLRYILQCKKFISIFIIYNFEHLTILKGITL